jgi:hypothetical protein
MMNFKIDPEFSSYLPRQTAEERQTLEEKITEEGCAPGALVVGEVKGEMILLDGHTTLEICSELKVEPADPRVIRFRNRDDAKRWMRRHQLARRNLTDEQRTYYLGEEFNAQKQRRGGPRGDSAKTDKPGREPIPHFEGLVPDETSDKSANSETAERLAREHGVSRATVERAGAFAEAVNGQAPVDRETILSGNSGLTKQEVVAGERPVRCGRCERKGLWLDDCADCKAAREKAKKKKPEPPEGLSEEAAALLKKHKVKATEEQLATLARYGEETQLSLAESVVGKRQTLDRAVSTGEVPDVSVEEAIKEVNGRIESFCRKLTDFVNKECPDDFWLSYQGRRDVFFQKVKDCCAQLRGGKCHEVCPKCDGAGCAVCLKTGRLPRLQYDQVA